MAVKKAAVVKAAQRKVAAPAPKKVTAVKVTKKPAGTKPKAPAKGSGSKKPTKPKAPAKPSKPKAPAKAPTPAAPQLNAGGTQYTSPSTPENAVANSTGNVSLQTNYDLDEKALEAQREYDDNLNNFEETLSRARMNVASNKSKLEQERTTGLGKINNTMAYRGMGYSTVARENVAGFNGEVNKAKNELDDELNQAENSYGSPARQRLAARLAARNSEITAARGRYTIGQSGTNPTEGSRPEASGVSPITLDPVTKKPVATKVTKVTKKSSNPPKKSSKTPKKAAKPSKAKPPSKPKAKASIVSAAQRKLAAAKKGKK